MERVNVPVIQLFISVYMVSFNCLCVMATGLLCNSMLPVVSFCICML